MPQHRKAYHTVTCLRWIAFIAIASSTDRSNLRRDVLDCSFASPVSHLKSKPRGFFGYKSGVSFYSGPTNSRSSPPAGGVQRIIRSGTVISFACMRGKISARRGIARPAALLHFARPPSLSIMDDGPSRNPL